VEVLFCPIVPLILLVLMQCNGFVQQSKKQIEKRCYGKKLFSTSEIERDRIGESGNSNYSNFKEMEVNAIL